MKALLIAVCMLAMSGAVVAQDRVVIQDEAAQSAWREDVDTLIEQLIAIHPQPFFRFPESEFRRVAAQLEDDLPYLTDDQIIAELARITAMLDGHTYLFLLQPSAGFHLYPIRLFAFDEGVYVVNAAPEYRDLIGQRLLSVNDIPAQSVLDMLAPYSSSDNPFYLRLWLPALLVMPELLQALGVIDALDQPRFEFMDAAGELVTADFGPISLTDYIGWNQDSLYALIGLPSRDETPFLSGSSEAFWSTLLDDTATLYVQYNQVARSSASGMTISALAGAIQEAAEQGTAERLVIDLRNNGGGDNTTYGPLLRSIQQSEFNQPGRLFVLTSRLTFSAGKDFALDVQQGTDGIFVGEPTGGMPNNYGDNRLVRLPNSGLEVRIAARNIARSGEADPGLWIAPDVWVPITAADYFGGRDAALEAALAYRSE